MRSWRVAYDAKTKTHTHTLPAGRGYALALPAATQIFRKLGVGATLWDGAQWWTVHGEPSIVLFELEHGAEKARSRYNLARFDAAQKQRRLVRGEHAGYCDLFAPIILDGQVAAVLAVGQFSRVRPTSATILEHWQELTRRQGHPADPEFAAYLATALSRPVLGDRELARFEELLKCLAHLLGEAERADELVNRIEVLSNELEPVRATERMWSAVKQMLDDRSQRVWQSMYHAFALHSLGLSRIADHVLVGFAVNGTRPADAVDEAVRCNGLQRAAVELARAAGEVIAGQVGDHGVVFLSAGKGSALGKRQKLLELSDRTRMLARRQFGLRVHFGASVTPQAATLSRSYQAALSAAEAALGQGSEIVFAEPDSKHAPDVLRDLRPELVRVLVEQPTRAPAAFERYLEAVAVRSGYREEAARAYLDVAFEYLAEELTRSGTLDRRSLNALESSLDRAAAGALTLSDLFAAYRSSVRDLAEAVRAPVVARRDRSLRAALDYLAEHYAEPIRLAKVAKMASFAPSHFSKLFIQRERMSLANYVAKLRVERAEQLLANTTLDVTRVAELVGYRSLEYLCRVFRRTLGVTPSEYRRGQRRERVGSTRGSSDKNAPKYRERRAAIR